MADRKSHRDDNDLVENQDNWIKEEIMKCMCGEEIIPDKSFTSYSVRLIAWCKNCGAYFERSMNKSTKEFYGGWMYHAKHFTFLNNDSHRRLCCHAGKDRNNPARI